MGHNLAASIDHCCLMITTCNRIKKWVVGGGGMNMMK